MLIRMLFALALVIPAQAQESDSLPLEDLPVDVRPFVTDGTQPLFLIEAELDGSAGQTYLLVLETPDVDQPDPELAEHRRTLLLLVRQADGSLAESQRNEKVIYCATCGGMMGDPFQGIHVEPGVFSVGHYGGSSWRWGVSYQFRYSRDAGTWQLARIEETSFNVGDSEEEIETKIYTYPEHFGRIDFADFDPDNWTGQGAR